MNLWGYVVIYYFKWSKNQHDHTLKPTAVAQRNRLQKSTITEPADTAPSNSRCDINLMLTLPYGAVRQALDSRYNGALTVCHYIANRELHSAHIPAIIGREIGYTLNRSPLCLPANTIYICVYIEYIKILFCFIVDGMKEKERDKFTDILISRFWRWLRHGHWDLLCGFVLR